MCECPAPSSPEIEACPQEYPSLDLIVLGLSSDGTLASFYENFYKDALPFIKNFIVACLIQLLLAPLIRSQLDARYRRKGSNNSRAPRKGKNVFWYIAALVSLLRMKKDVDALVVPDLTRELTDLSTYPIARGGFADVYKGSWRKQITNVYGRGEVDERQVAVKVLRAFIMQKWGSARAQKKLSREVAIWQHLNHRNIARFYGTSYSFHSIPSLVMEWYPNGTADVFLRGKEIKVKLRVIHDIACGLSYLHSRNPPIVHGDLKGNNVLIDDSDHAVLCDFGLSNIVEDIVIDEEGRASESNGGSLRWQSPELLLGQEVPSDQPSGRSTFGDPCRHNKRSDVWALGCTIYELMSGKLPFSERENDFMITLNLLAKVSPFKSMAKEDVPDDTVCNVMKQCVNLEPCERPTAAEVEEVMYNIYAEQDARAE